MSGQANKIGAVGKPGTVSRIDPGRLVYVDVPALGQTFPVKPDKFTLTAADGSKRHYRGEPFKQLGINIGTKVEVIPVEKLNGHGFDADASPLDVATVVVRSPSKKTSLMRRFRYFDL